MPGENNNMTHIHSTFPPYATSNHPIHQNPTLQFYEASLQPGATIYSKTIPNTSTTSHHPDAYSATDIYLKIYCDGDGEMGSFNETGTFMNASKSSLNSFSMVSPSNSRSNNTPQSIHKFLENQMEQYLPHLIELPAADGEDQETTPLSQPPHLLDPRNATPLVTFPLSQLDFLDYALSVTRILQKIHSLHVIHAGIAADCCWVKENDESALMDGFYWSRIVSTKQPYITKKSKQQFLGRRGVFMAPEQFSTASPIVDYRMDLYQLGALFYFLLSKGETPFSFDSKDRSGYANDSPTQEEWEQLQQHILHSDPPPLKRTPDIIRNIVKKLMQKNPKHRYQNCEAIIHDLEKCQEILKNQSVFRREPANDFNFERNFEGQQKTLCVTNKIYGRQHELDTLIRVQEAVEDSGQSNMIVVEGKPGVGKRHLVNHVIQNHFEEALFLSGRYDCIWRNRDCLGKPHEPLLEALENFVQVLINEPSEEKLLSFSDFVSDRLTAEQLSALLEFCSSVWKLVLRMKEVSKNGKKNSEEKQKAPWNSVPQPIYVEGEERLRLLGKALRQLFGCFHEVYSRSIIIHLQNMHFSDLYTVRLMNYVLGNDGDGRASHASSNLSNSHHNTTADNASKIATNASPSVPLLLIVSYNQMVDAHPLAAYVTRHAPPHLKLKPMSLKEVTQLVRDSLDFTNVSELAQFIHTRTQGNHYFVSELLIHLHRTEVLTYNERHDIWTWDTVKMQTASFSSNIVDFMLQAEFETEFSTEAQKLLQYGAAQGHFFTLNDIPLFGQPISVAKLHMCEAIQAGWVEEFDSGCYQFLHEFVQEAAYMSVKITSSRPIEEKQNEIHDDIAHYMLKRDKKTANSSSVQNSVNVSLQDSYSLAHPYQICFHLNHVLNILPSAEKKTALLLNQSAAEYSLRAASPQCAHYFAEVANSLLGATPWIKNYHQTLDVKVLLSQTLIDSQSYDAAIAILKSALGHTSSHTQDNTPRTPSDSSLDGSSSRMKDKFRVSSHLLKAYSIMSRYSEGSQVLLQLISQHRNLTHNMPVNNETGIQIWLKNRLGMLIPLMAKYPTANRLLEELPSVDDPVIGTFMECLSYGCTHLIFTQQEALFAATLLLLGEYILEHGIFGISIGLSLCQCAFIYNKIVKDLKNAAKLAQAGLLFARHPNYYNSNNLAGALYFYGFVNHIDGTLQNCIETHREGYTLGVQCRNCWSGFNCFQCYYLMFFAGTPIEEAHQFESEARQHFKHSSFTLDHLSSIKQLYRVISDENVPHTYTISYQHSNFESMPYARFLNRACKMVYYYLLDNLNAAYEEFVHAIEYIEDSNGCWRFYIRLFGGLICSDMIETQEMSMSKLKELSNTLSQVEEYTEKMKNETTIFHLPHYHILAAEKLRAEKSVDMAQIIEHYTGAIESAQENGASFIAALAQTRMVSYYALRGMNTNFISITLNEAYRLWKRCNGDAIIERLRVKYADIIRTAAQSGSGTPGTKNPEEYESELDALRRKIASLEEALAQERQGNSSSNGSSSSNGNGPNNKEMVSVASQTGYHMRNSKIIMM